MNRLRVAIGPELSEFGSWNWIGCDLVDSLREQHQVLVFSDVAEPPEADVIIFLKFKPSSTCLEHLGQSTRLIYVPVDVYDGIWHIEADRKALICFDLIIVHCQRLVRYFVPMSLTNFVDHSLKYISRQTVMPKLDGDLLWVGRSCNIGPVVHWANNLSLDRRLRILTNDVADLADPRQLGFTRRNEVIVETWSEIRHITALDSTIAGLDVKGSDFRSRHKPPAKVLDYLASGLPVIVNQGGSADFHLRTIGITPLYSESGVPQWENIDFSDVRNTAEVLRNTLNRMIVLDRLNALFTRIKH